MVVNSTTSTTTLSCLFDRIKNDTVGSMHFRDKPTWAMYLDSSSEIIFALYVRDALNITSPTAGEVPPLDPAVPVPNISAPPEVERQWGEWWARITGPRLAPGGNSLIPVEHPAALEDEIQRLRPEYSQWAWDLRQQETRSGQPHTRDIIPVKEVVDAVQLELGQEYLGFALSIQEIPVKGRYWHRLARDTVMASSTLLRSEEAIPKLQTLIRELAAQG
jgi:hypothetical protein